MTSISLGDILDDPSTKSSVVWISYLPDRPREGAVTRQTPTSRRLIIPSNNKYRIGIVLT